MGPPPPTIFAEPAAQYSSVPVRCTRCRRPNVLCSSGGLACAARWPPTLPFPFFLTLWHGLHCCAALHECGATPSEVKGGAVRRKDGTLLHRENKKTEKSQKRTFLPALLAARQGLGYLHALKGRHAGVVPPAQTCRPSLQLQQTRARSCSATFLFLMLVI